MNKIEFIMNNIPDKAYKKTPDSNLYKIMNAISNKYDEMVSDMDKVRNSKFIDYASGSDLDKIAALLKLKRLKNENDITFRGRIKSRVPSFIGGGTLKSIEQVITNLLGVKPTIIEHYKPGNGHVSFDTGILSGFTPQLMDNKLIITRGSAYKGGVRYTSDVDKEFLNIGSEIQEFNRLYFNSKVFVTNKDDIYYKNKGYDNVLTGGTFGSASQDTGDVLGGFDTPSSCWTTINLAKLYTLLKQDTIKSAMILSADFLVNAMFDGEFYGSPLKLIPNEITYNSNTKQWDKKKNVVHLRTLYHSIWALLEAYTVVNDIRYKNAAIQLMDTAATYFNNIKQRASTGAELVSWMSGAVYNTLVNDGGINYVPDWLTFSNTTIDVIIHSIDKYISLFGDGTRNDKEGTQYTISNLKANHVTWFTNALNNQGMRMTNGVQLLYCFYRFEWDDAQVNGRYVPKSMNWDFLDNIWGKDQWFTGDLQFWAIIGAAMAGLTTQATDLMNKYYAIRANNTLLWYDRYNVDGSTIENDESISISFTGLFLKLANQLNNTTYNDLAIQVLKDNQIKSSNKIIDGGYAWDIVHENQVLESKTLGEIAFSFNNVRSKAIGTVNNYNVAYNTTSKSVVFKKTAFNDSDFKIATFTENGAAFSNIVDLREKLNPTENYITNTASITIQVPYEFSEDKISFEDAKKIIQETKAAGVAALMRVVGVYEDKFCIKELPLKTSFLVGFSGVGSDAFIGGQSNAN